MLTHMFLHVLYFCWLNWWCNKTMNVLIHWITETALHFGTVTCLWIHCITANPLILLSCVSLVTQKFLSRHAWYTGWAKNVSPYWSINKSRYVTKSLLFACTPTQEREHLISSCLPHLTILHLDHFDICCSIFGTCYATSIIDSTSDHACVILRFHLGLLTQ